MSRGSRTWVENNFYPKTFHLDRQITVDVDNDLTEYSLEASCPFPVAELQISVGYNIAVTEAKDTPAQRTFIMRTNMLDENDVIIALLNKVQHTHVNSATGVVFYGYADSFDQSKAFRFRFPLEKLFDGAYRFTLTDVDQMDSGTIFVHFVFTGFG